VLCGRRVHVRAKRSRSLFTFSFFDTFRQAACCSPLAHCTNIAPTFLPVSRLFQFPRMYPKGIGTPLTGTATFSLRHVHAATSSALVYLSDMPHDCIFRSAHRCQLPSHVSHRALLRWTSSRLRGMCPSTDRAPSEVGRIWGQCSNELRFTEDYQLRINNN
jgi:hypothetical protein